MVYRVATMDDIEILAELRKKQLIDEGCTPNVNMDDELIHFFQAKMKDQSLVEWVAEDNNEIVATGAIIFFEFPPSFSNKSGMRGYIANMYTAPEYRGRGIAVSMLDKLVEEAKKRNVAGLWLIASKMGRPVYLKYGFEEAEDWMNLEGDLWNG